MGRLETGLFLLGAATMGVANFILPGGLMDGGRSGASPTALVSIDRLAEAPDPAFAGVLYRSCAHARSAGAAPIPRGAPGYRPLLDRRGTGLACEA